MRTTIPVLILVFVLNTIYGQEKIPITKAEDLPEHYYLLEDSVALDYLKNKDLSARLAGEVMVNLLEDLDKYDIKDKATLQNYSDLLAMASFLTGDYPSTIEYIERGREYAEKESEKYMWNLQLEMFVRTALETGTEDGDAFRSALAEKISNALSATSFDVIGNEVKERIGSLEIISENLFTGLAQGMLQPMIDNAQGQVMQTIAYSLLSLRLGYETNIPYAGEVYLPVYQTYYDQHHVEVELVDIWEEREVKLDMKEKINPVIIGIWDGGVDTDVFPADNTWTNTQEKPDGIDNDGNGFIDDIHGIAFGLEGDPEVAILYPAEKELDDIDLYKRYSKGFSDLGAQVESDEQDELKKYFTSLKPEELNPFIENLSLYGNYSHGTHVAGIAVNGNPKARILVVRITYDYKTIPPPPTEEILRKWAISYERTSQYLRDNGVKAVNMSWSDDQKYYEDLLALNGVGNSPEERKELAHKYFTVVKNALYDAIKESPNILFITSAGNSDDDVEFAATIPQGFDLPNILCVGAVDIEGKETSFTSSGAKVDVYANGYEVESFVPGGDRIKYSGTSMSAPMVTNLAGMLWSVYPDLTVEKVKELIIKGAAPSESNPDILLINPKRSMELAEEMILK